MRGLTLPDRARDFWRKFLACCCSRLVSIEPGRVRYAGSATWGSDARKVLVFDRETVPKICPYCP
jgi:hypothetical protein